MIDVLIKVDRSKKPNYPSWVRTVLHPEYESSGPVQFYLNNLDLSFYENQKYGSDSIIRVYDHFKKNGFIKNCLNLADLRAIQEKGVEIFQSFYKDQVIFGLNSIVESELKNLFAPCLLESENKDKIILRWASISKNLYSGNLFPLFRK